jgi:hypothetical protein
MNKRSYLSAVLIAPVLIAMAQHAMSQIIVPDKSASPIIVPDKPTKGTIGGCILSAGNSGDMQGTLLRTSGNEIIDRAFNVEAQNLNQVFRVNASIFMLSGNVKNAYATPETVDSPTSDGRVIFSIPLLQDEFAQTGAWNNFTVIVIMAHEFGHIYQFKYGTQKLPVKLTELQADYLAGWYIGRREKVSSWKTSALQQAMTTLYNKGDYAFNNPTHHGTPQERLQAVNEGINHANLSLAAVYKQSLEFVSAIGE